MHKKLIISADDYGVVPSIDAGIEHAAAKGAINSVNVLANHMKDGKSLSAENGLGLQRKAQDGNWNIEIGSHLSITSGVPVTDIDPENRYIVHVKNGRRVYRKFGDLACPDEPEKAQALREQMVRELRTQNTLLHQAGIDLKYLSDHHGALSFFRPFYEAYLEVAKDPLGDGSIGPLPIRSFKVLPRKQSKLFNTLAMFVFRLDEDLYRPTDMHFLRKEEDYRIAKAASDPDIHTPDMLNMVHYKPALTKAKTAKALEKMIRKKREAILAEMLEFHRNSPAGASGEFIVHLRKGGLRPTLDDYRKEVPEEYLGINHKMFANRTAELDSICGLHSEHHPDRLHPLDRFEMQGVWTSERELA